MSSNDSYMLLTVSLTFSGTVPWHHMTWKIDVHEIYTKKYSYICILASLLCYFVIDYKLSLFIGNTGFTYKVRLGQFSS